MLCLNCGRETGKSKKKHCCNKCIHLDRLKKITERLTKKCPKCNKELPNSEFKTKTGKRLYRSYCHKCIVIWFSEKQARLTTEEKETRLAKRRAYQYKDHRSFLYLLYPALKPDQKEITLLLIYVCKI